MGFMKDLNKFLLPVLVILFFFVALFAYTRLVGPIPFSVNSVVTNKTDTFMVTGEGKSFVKPDIAYVSAGVESSGTTVKQVQTQMNTTINKVTAALKDLGVEEKDIKTTNYSIHPNYDWTSGRQRITGYRASTNLQIKVRDIDKVNDVVDQATANGANNVGNISFDVDDKTETEDIARKEAVTEAKRKAEQAAQIAGFRLGKIINYSENKSGSVVPVAYDMALKSARGAANESTELQPGSSEVRVMVTLSYELE